MIRKEEISEFCQQLVNQIPQLNQEYEYYRKNYYCDNYFGRKEYENYRKETLRGETMLDKLYETRDRNRLVMTKGMRIMEIINQIRNIIIDLMDKTVKEGKKIEYAIYSSIENLKMINENQMMKELMAQQRQITEKQMK